jgi:hypothetical protein
VNVVNADRGEAVYLPAAAGTINRCCWGCTSVMPPSGLTGRVRELALAVDPDLVMGEGIVLSDGATGRLVPS